MTTRNAPPFAATVIATWVAGAPLVSLRALRPIMAKTTTRSCTIRKPNAIRPCKVSTSRLSDSSLTIIMVLEKVNATAT